MKQTNNIERLRYLQSELRMVRFHIIKFNNMLDTLGYDDVPPLSDNESLMQRISQEIAWLDV